MNRSRTCRHRGAFTLVEVLVAVAALSMVFAVMYSLLTFGLTLFVKNVAVNMAHQQARNGLMRVSRDIHRSVSIPKLLDENMQPISGAGPAAGVSFQVVSKGPFKVKNDPSSPSLIHLEAANPKPVAPAVGDHIIVLDYDVEAEISRVTAQGSGSNHWNLFLKEGVERRIVTDGSSFAVCYITQRIGYAVKNGELRYYPNLTATPELYHVVSQNITSGTPFKVPLNATGALDSRYTSVTISAKDPTYSGRSYKGTSMQLVDARVPYRCQLTKFQ